MDLYLSREKINLARNVLNTNITQEETMEMIVPDALPDILRVVDVDVTVLVRGKDTDAGRVSVSGIAAATVIYCPEGTGGVRKINIDVPFSMSAVEGEISPNSKVTAHVMLVSADASIINPRKFVVRVELRANIACYNEVELSVCTDVDVGDEAGIELLMEKCVVNTPVDVREKAFVISDELMLPGSGPELGEVLKTRVVLSAEEAKVVGNKVIFRGNTNVSLLYNPEDGGEPCGAELTSEFSQIMELDNMPEDGDFEITLMLTGAYFESGVAAENKTLSAELHVVAQCVAIEKRAIPYISDVYSTKYKLDKSTEELVLENRDSAAKINTIYRGMLDAAGTPSRVLAVSVNTGATEAEVESSAVTLKAPLYVTAIYITDDGRVMSSSGKFEAEATSEVREGCKYTVSAECGREIYGVVSGGGIELRIPVDFTVTETAAMTIWPIYEISYDEEEAIDTSKMPSLIISKAEDTLWKLAKKYHSTTPLILSANGLESEDDIALGQMLIIPKKR